MNWCQEPTVPTWTKPVSPFTFRSRKYLTHILFLVEKRSDKRSLKLLRGSERDLKLDITSAQLNSTKNAQQIKGKTPQPFIQVEGCRRFMSLCSRRVACRETKSAAAMKASFTTAPSSDYESAECPQSRVDFHKMLSLLIRMGCSAGEERHPRRNVRELHFLLFIWVCWMCCSMLFRGTCEKHLLFMYSRMLIFGIASVQRPLNKILDLETHKHMYNGEILFNNSIK